MRKNWYSYRNNGIFETYISQKKVLYNFREYFCESYYNIVSRDNEKAALALEDAPAKADSTFEDLLQLIKEKRCVDIISTGFVRPRRTVKYDGVSYIYLENEYSEEEFAAELKRDPAETAVIEHVSADEKYGPEGTLLTVVVLNDNRTKPEIADAYFKWETANSFSRNNIDISTGKSRTADIGDDLWKKICDLVTSISTYLSSFDLMRYEIQLAADRIILRNVMPQLNGFEEAGCSTELKNFITKWKERLDDPTETRAQRLKEQEAFDEKWQKQTENCHRKGMRPYMAFLFDGEMKKDEADAETTPEEKKWAHERGFFSYRIKELGLDESNFRDYVSDYDYFWVNRINSHYQAWIDDKLSMRYALDQYSEYFPDYFYAIRNINGEKKILALPDLPDGYGNTEEDLISLLKKKGSLAVKRNYGTHGEGFFKLEYCKGAVLMNGQQMSAEDVLERVSLDESIMLVTEYIEMHDFIKNIYPDTLNTVRVNCFTETGKEPAIGACFLKVGHSEGGFTDNINTAAGGICASLNKADGRIVLPEFKKGNHYYPCPVHPDTGAPVEGTIPFWDEIIKAVRTVAAGMPQLQYFGFDIAVTPDGPKIIEINVFPDYTKYVVRDKETQEFLRKKLAEKKFACGLNFIPEADGGKLFDIVMPSYNVTEYIDQAVGSIINQTIGFEENVRLIIVDDGSTDGLYRKCMEYCRNYPENIFYVRKENGGLSSARNEGLKYCYGSYVTFFDADDYWAEDALEKVAAFYEKCGDDIDLVECRTEWFEDKKGYYSLDFRFDKGSRIINIHKEPENPQVAVNSAFIRTKAIKDKRFVQTLTIGEDARFVTELLFEKEQYGVLKEAVYHRRQRKSGTSLTQTAGGERIRSVYSDTPELYYRYIYELSEKKYGQIIPYAQYLVMDAVRYRLSLKMPDELSAEEAENYRNILLDLIQKTDFNIICNMKNGSIGARMNLLKYKLQPFSMDSIKYDGDIVTVNGTAVGRMNTSAAMGISSVMTEGKQTSIRGDIFLPWFARPQLWCRDRKGNTEAVIKKIEDRQNLDIMGDHVYNRYSFEVTLKKRKHNSVEFYLTHPEGIMILRPNIRRGCEHNADIARKNSALTIGKKPEGAGKKIRRIGRKIKRHLF